jgi:peptidoglycan/LPS O-acetylase OafA/YrhL
MGAEDPSGVALRHGHGRLDALTGVRAVAALWVVLYHFQDKLLVLVPALRVGSPILSGGYLGVDLFFTLSGFILAYNYLERLGRQPSLQTYGRFLWLRLARIWPVHFFALNVMLALVVGAHLAGISLNSAESIRYGPGAYVENVTLTQVWWRSGLSFNGPAWSVSAEWFVYLLFPVAAVALVRSRSSWLSWTGAGLCYGLLEVRFGLLVHGGASATSGALSRVGLEFLAGCFLYRIWESARSRRSGPPMLCAAVVGLAAGVWALDGPGYHGLLLAPLFGLVVLGIALGADAPLLRPLARRRVVFWGEASYSLYMTHEIVNMVVSKVLPAARFRTDDMVVRGGVLLVYGALVTLAAVGTYLWVERPARERLRKVSVPRGRHVAVHK